MANRELVITMAKRMLIDSIWKSTIIEGLGTTFPTTAAVLANAPSSARPSDVQFILNMKRAWEFLFDSLDLPNNLALLRQFNEICGKSIIYGSGELRQSVVKISGSSYIPPIPVYDEVVSDLNQLDGIQNPIGKAIAYFCYVTRNQLFIDGNKRIAQLMMNKILIENSIGYLYIEEGKMERFVECLLHYYDTEDLSKIFPFMESCVFVVED